MHMLPDEGESDLWPPEAQSQPEQQLQVNLPSQPRGTLEEQAYRNVMDKAFGEMMRQGMEEQFEYSGTPEFAENVRRAQAGEPPVPDEQEAAPKEPPEYDERGLMKLPRRRREYTKEELEEHSRFEAKYQRELERLQALAGGGQGSQSASSNGPGSPG